MKKNLFSYLLSRRYRIPIIGGLLIVAAAMYLYGTQHAFLQKFTQRIEAGAYDLRLLGTLPDNVEPDPRLIIVDIDEYSLQQEGQWPWARSRLAELLFQLAQAEPAVIGFDIMFPEAERNLLEEILRRKPEALETQSEEQIATLGVLAEELDGDQEFAGALSLGQTVLGFSFGRTEDTDMSNLPTPVAEIEEGSPFSLRAEALLQPVANIPLLQEAAAGSGFFSIQPDADGVIRHVSTLMRYQNFLYPSLALEVVRQYLGAPPLELQAVDVDGELVLENISIGGALDIGVDPDGLILIPFRGPPGSFSYVSAHKILSGEFDHAPFRDSIVLIGTSASGLEDLRATPVDEIFPGVEVMANIIIGMLDSTLPSTTSVAEGIDIAIVLVAGVLFSLVFPVLRPGLMVLISISAIASYTYLSVWLWTSEGIVISLALPLLVLFLIATLNAVYGFSFEARSRNQLKSMFGQYVPPSLVHEMNQNLNANYGFDGESREMTVLFCDIRSFTTISEALPANELKSLLNFFFTPMTELIFNNRGTIDKYVGDMIMAFWGAPLPDEKHRHHAIRTALDMLDKVDELQEALRQRNWPPISIGIGLNTGMMNVGDMGSEFRRSYTVIGDAVNLGSRLEGLTKFYGVRLIVSEFTRDDIEDFVFRPLDRVKVKGKNEPVAIFEPVGSTDSIDAGTLADLAEFESALDDYKAQRWDQATEKLMALSVADPDRAIYHLYIERIRTLATQQLPDGWDGVFTHTSK